MSKSEQLQMFDLPETPVGDKPKEPAVERRSRPARQRARQIPMGVRLYNVSYGPGSCQVQAATRSAAKYAAFKIFRETGMFLYDGGFLAFVSSGVKVAELRR